MHVNAAHASCVSGYIDPLTGHMGAGILRASPRISMNRNIGLAKKFVWLVNALFNKVLGENEKKKKVSYFLLKTAQIFWLSQYLGQSLSTTIRSFQWCFRFPLLFKTFFQSLKKRILLASLGSRFLC